MYKQLAILLTSVFLISCSGGGSESKSSNGQLTLSATSVEFSAEIGGVTPDKKYVTGSVVGATQSVYITVDASSVSFLESAEVYFTNDNSANLELTPISPDLLEPGVYSETLTVSVCLQASCQTHISGSPKRVTVTYTVSDNRFTVNTSLVEHGTILEANGMYQCTGTCSSGVSGNDGDQLEFKALPHPGYEFVEWVGSCASNDICTAQYEQNKSVEVSAVFRKSSSDFDLCPSESNETFSGSGEDRSDGLNEFYVPDGAFIPLCNGHVIIGDTILNQVIVRDIINQNTSATFQLSASPWEMVLDEPNKQVYVTHLREDFISRIDLATGLVSDIHILGGGDSIAMSDDGALFVSNYGQEQVLLLDSLSAIQNKTFPISNVYSIAHLSYDDVTDRLFVTEGDNAYIYNFLKESQTLEYSVAFAEDSWGHNCNNPVVISPDGNHGAYVCGSGNGSGYNVHDLNTAIPNESFGVWDTGSYPQSASFTSSSKNVLLSDGDYLQLFAVDTHQLVLQHDPEVYSCYGTIKTVSVSPDDKLLYGVSDCGSFSVISWVANN